MGATSVGILGYQGCIEPHEKIFRALKVECIRVKVPADLKKIDRLILPGGESTTMLRFMKLYDMFSAVKDFSHSHPVWGICAGSILLAKEVTNPSQESLNLIDIKAHRNFYGSQLDSFNAEINIDLCDKPITAQFIRAPLLTPTSSDGVSENVLKIHAYYREQPVFFSQGSIWACSFHVELGSDLELHRAFLGVKPVG